jgi:hypothetical protein
MECLLLFVLVVFLNNLSQELGLVNFIYQYGKFPLFIFYFFVKCHYLAWYMCYQSII